MTDEQGIKKPGEYDLNTWIMIMIIIMIMMMMIIIIIIITMMKYDCQRVNKWNPNKHWKGLVDTTNVLTIRVKSLCKVYIPSADFFCSGGWNVGHKWQSLSRANFSRRAKLNSANNSFSETWANKQSIICVHILYMKEVTLQVKCLLGGCGFVQCNACIGINRHAWQLIGHLPSCRWQCIQCICWIIKSQNRQ